MSQINKPTDYFNTVLYTGTGSTSNSVTGVGFQPDWLWLKSRSNTYPHFIYDAVRTNRSALFTNNANAEDTGASNQMTSFDSDGFTVVDSGGSVGTNASGATFVSWNWLGGGTASSNTDGSITSSVSASTTSGFSVVTYSGSNSNSSIGHGLGVAPKVIIIKNRTSGSTAWFVGHDSLGWTKKINLQDTAAAATYNGFQDTAPTSSVFTLTGNVLDICQSGSDYVAYCFAEKKGFSKFGSFTGNGNADGTFVYTGFKPAFIIEKRSNATGSWLVFDSKRNGINGDNHYFYADGSDAELTTQLLDITSNGFKHRHAGGANGGESIYMAFAENPLVGTNNIPATAR